MKKFVVSKRVIAVLLCMFLCFVLPLGASALTEQQVRDIPQGVYNVRTWGDYQTVYGNMATPMVDAGILRNSSVFGTYYVLAEGRLNGGCTTRIVTDVKYKVAMFNSLGQLTSYEYVTITKDTDTFTLAAQDMRTVETQFIRDTNYSSNQFVPGATTMDAYVIAYVPSPFNYWAGKHLKYENMP